MVQLKGALLLFFFIDFCSSFPNREINEQFQYKRSINVGYKSKNEIAATVREVESLIQANPSLPRLTRGEILDILENITKSDFQKTLLRNKTRDPKAIMVVMPYTPNGDDSKNIEDLYTKPPVTQIIGNDNTRQQNIINNQRVKSRRRPPLKVQTPKPDIEQNRKVEIFHRGSPFVTTEKPKPLEYKSTTTKHDVTSERTTNFPVTAPERITINIEEIKTTQFKRPTPDYQHVTENSVTKRPQFRRRTQATTTVKSLTEATTFRPRSRRPIRRKTTPVKTITIETFPIKSTTQIPTTKLKNTAEPELITAPPSDFENENQNTHGYVRFNPRTGQYVSNEGLVLINPPPLVLPQDINKDLYDLTTEDESKDDYYKPEYHKKKISTKYHPAYKNKPQSNLATEIDIPEHLHAVVKDMNLDPSLMNIPENYYKSYDSTAQESKVEEDRRRLQNLLESLGIVHPLTTERTTSTKVPDVSHIADTLSPEMQELLMSFGLIPNPDGNLEKTTPDVPFYPEPSQIDPASYIGFKPLPDDGESRNEMENLLAQFGLGRNSRRSKAIKNNVNPNLVSKDSKKTRLNFDVVPEAYKDVIKDIGFEEFGKKLDMQTAETTFKPAYIGTTRTSLQIKTNETADESDNDISDEVQATREIILQQATNKNDNALDDSQYATKEEIEKLKKLMDIIQQFDKMDRNATEDDIKKIDMSTLKEIVQSLNNDKKVSLADKKALNPINFDQGFAKNEIKRQDDLSLTKLTIVTPSAPTTTEESKIPSIKDLEDSFGGQLETSTSQPVESTTASKRTGFYYLVDWNSFLDIDNQEGKRVNLRLQPTIGDPKRFISVNVP